MKVKEMLNKMFVNSDITGVHFAECGKELKGYGMGCIESAVKDFGNRKLASFEIRQINTREYGYTHILKINIYPEEG